MRPREADRRASAASRVLTFGRDGAELFAGWLREGDCLEVEEALADLPRDKAGVRIGSAPALRSMLSADGRIGAVATHLLGHPAQAVRAVLFDKTAATNWGLGWHQDRTIVVEERADVPGFGPWTIKAGLQQAEPPFVVIDRMVTLRVHLDPVDEANAPLGIIPGSHRLGRLLEADLTSLVFGSAQELCLAERGDIWAYATPIVHGSRPAERPERRRVLQVDYSAEELPEPLHWRGL